ncbi:MAG: hypothetical protein LBU86_05465 [Oscillospiraceae bacterium]|jgi:stage III sporulation protein AG|nr:hypothetical protein [Oscillospiraceae bacterium]
MAVNNFSERILAFLKKDIKLKLVVGLGLLGMLMILLSYFNESGAGAPDSPPNNLTATYAAEEYADKLEEKLSGLITQIDGVGRNEVMVTLERGIEYVYAQEEKRATDKTSVGTGEEERETLNLTENVEQNVILVDSEYGRKEALVLTELEPKVQGVVIVCEGADDVLVEQKLTSVVTTALGVTSARVCVVKIS